MAAGNKVGYAMASKGLLTDQDASQRNQLGARYFDDNGNEYIYLQYAASSSIAAGDWVVYNNATAQASFTAIQLPTSATCGPVAVAMAAALSSAGFGWFQIFGLTPTTTNIATGSADGSVLALSGTAGRMVVGTSATKTLVGAVGVGSATSNKGTAFITYPYLFGADPV
jgi:hypothetical protein